MGDMMTFPASVEEFMETLQVINTRLYAGAIKNDML